MGRWAGIVQDWRRLKEKNRANPLMTGKFVTKCNSLKQILISRRVLCCDWGVDDPFIYCWMELINMKSMSDKQLELLLQEAEKHLRQTDCRSRYERAVNRLPDSRRGFKFGDDKRSAWAFWLTSRTEYSLVDRLIIFLSNTTSKIFYFLIIFGFAFWAFICWSYRDG